MTTPRSLVVYHYASWMAVYLDGQLAFWADGHLTAAALAELLGHTFERRDVRWEDWPGLHTTPSWSAVLDSRPPQALAEVERHFAAVAERRRVERIAELREELAGLESGAT